MVTGAVIGTDSINIVHKNIGLIKNFEPLSNERMKELHVELDPFFKSNKLP